MKSVRIGAGLGSHGDSWRPVRAAIKSADIRHIAADQKETSHHRAALLAGVLSRA